MVAQPPHRVEEHIHCLTNTDPRSISILQYPCLANAIGILRRVDHSEDQSKILLHGVRLAPRKLQTDEYFVHPYEGIGLLFSLNHLSPA